MIYVKSLGGDRFFYMAEKNGVVFSGETNAAGLKSVSEEGIKFILNK